MNYFTVLDFSGPKRKRLCDYTSLEAALVVFKREVDSSQVALVRADFFGDDAETELVIKRLTEQNEKLEADLEAQELTLELVHTEQTRRRASAMQRSAAERLESRDAEQAYQLARNRYLTAMHEARKDRDRKSESEQSQDYDIGR